MARLPPLIQVLDLGTEQAAMRQILVFIGFQFDSPHFRRTELEHIFIDAVQRAEADLNREQLGVKIRPVLFNLESGKAVNTQILDRIGKADICVFELSDLNPNVYFELGFATGRAKPCIYLFNEGRPVADLPSDLSGIYVLRYDLDTLGAKLASELRIRAENLSERHAPVRGAGDSASPRFWGFGDGESVYLVCPEIPVTERIPYADARQRDYLRLAKFADIDSLYHLKDFLARQFARVSFQECTSEEVPNQALEASLIVIGGVAWNRLNRELTARLGLPWVQTDGGPGNDDPYVDTLTGKRLLPVLAGDQSLQQDVSLFVRVPNPANRAKRLFVVSGIRTYGVLGAAKCFAADGAGEANCDHAFARFGFNPQFAVLFRTAVINNFVPVPNLSEDGVVLGAARYDSKRGVFALID